MSAFDLKQIADIFNCEDILQTIKKLSEIGDDSCIIEKYMSEQLINELSNNGVYVKHLEGYSYKLSWNSHELETLQIWLKEKCNKTYTIDELKGLKTLNLRGNILTSLPPEIGQLENLQKLNLSLNKLTSLPPEIGQLENLRGCV